MSFSSFGWGATSSQKSWFDYSPRHQNSLTNFLLKNSREGWGNYYMKNIVPFITSIYYPIWLWPKNQVLGGFPETSQLVDYFVRIAFKSKGRDSNDLVRKMDCFLVFLQYSPLLHYTYSSDLFEKSCHANLMMMMLCWAGSLSGNLRSDFQCLF